MGFKPRKYPHIAVQPGQMYRVPRQGKPAHHIRIVRVLEPRSRQPKARYVLVTRSGSRKQPKGAILNVTWLSWSDGSWRMPSAFELIE